MENGHFRKLGVSSITDQPPSPAAQAAMQRGNLESTPPVIQLKDLVIGITNTLRQDARRAHYPVDIVGARGLSDPSGSRPVSQRHYQPAGACRDPMMPPDRRSTRPFSRRLSTGRLDTRRGCRSPCRAQRSTAAPIPWTCMTCSATASGVGPLARLACYNQLHFLSRSMNAGERNMLS
jgi:hypothetical protein